MAAGMLRGTYVMKGLVPTFVPTGRLTCLLYCLSLVSSSSSRGWTWASTGASGLKCMMMHDSARI